MGKVGRDGDFSICKGLTHGGGELWQVLRGATHRSQDPQDRCPTVGGGREGNFLILKRLTEGGGGFWQVLRGVNFTVAGPAR